MNSWKKWIIGCAAALSLGATVHAAGGGMAWDKIPVKTTDTESLQRGAKLFVNYCLNCHSAAFMRYNRLQDIGITEQDIKDKLLFTTQKVGDTMQSAIDPVQAKAWFGTNPPDLTVIARSRAGAGGTGADYLYTFLRSFYVDDARPTGWNNTVFDNVGMPHVLWELQGARRAIFAIEPVHGVDTRVFKEWEQISPGTLTPEEFDKSVADLVNYLAWMAEPTQNKRKVIGIWVLLFTLGFTVLAWRLNAAYWKDVR
ncbi:MAG: cytochrome c1 [Burkholderiaceae bacterium]|nr:cytochrome c1 [Burkholderiaceae bacterium]